MGKMPSSSSSKKSASLHSCNNELKEMIQTLRQKRDRIMLQIQAEEDERTKLKEEIDVLTGRLGEVNDSLAKKSATRAEYDRTIEETEATYDKILESSRTLLHVLRREAKSLEKKHNGGGGTSETD